jgi:NADH-quinone oxidoreductase subunit M
MLNSFPYLSTLTYLPMLGFLIIVFGLDKENTKGIQRVAFWTTFADLLLSVPLFFHDWSSGAMQFVEDRVWIESIGAHYKFGIDGFSGLLILLTTLLGFISIYCSYTAITHRNKEYYAFLLFLQTGMLGVFCALDFVLFYLFWEVMLVPMYFLIGIWGGPRKLYAAIKFFLYTLFGSVVMLLGIVALYFWNTTGFAGIAGLGNAPTLDILHFQAVAHLMPAHLQMWLFFAFFLGFAIKVPMFPFHTWLPDAHVEAPTAGSVILAGVLLKMGTYGFVRFSLPLFPQASQDGMVVQLMAALAIIGIVYGSLVAMMQKDMKKLVAYSSVAHLGFVMLGIFALNTMGLRGAILQMINHGISTGALFLLVGIVYERRHTRLISEYGGLAKQMPIYAMFFMVITLSSIGVPGLNGFIGEFTILLGAFAADARWGVWAALGIVLGAAYMLWLYQRVFFGPLENEENKKLQDLNLREAWTLIPLVACAFWIGLYPAPFFRMIEKPVEKVVAAIQAESISEHTKSLSAEVERARQERKLQESAPPAAEVTPGTAAPAPATSSALPAEGTSAAEGR